MREKEPICFNHQADMWNVFVRRCKTVLEDKEYFSNNMPEKKKSPFSQSILGMDPPKHTQIRSIVNRSFTPKALRNGNLESSKSQTIYSINYPIVKLLILLGSYFIRYQL